MSPSELLEAAETGRTEERRREAITELSQMFSIPSGRPTIRKASTEAGMLNICDNSVIASRRRLRSRVIRYDGTRC